MATIDLTHTDGATVLSLRAGENRFNPDTLGEIEAALDRVEADGTAGALVLTGEGKFFSNGLDLDWMGAAPAGEPEEVVRRVHALFARVLAFPAVTVAAINGHAFAAGAMLALCCDLRVMRADRGFVCLPEVDIGIPFTPGMTALLRARLAPVTATRAMVLGERFGGPVAQAAGLVDAVADEDRVLPAAIELAGGHSGKKGATVQAIKNELYAEPLAVLRAAATA